MQITNGKTQQMYVFVKNKHNTPMENCVLIVYPLVQLVYPKRSARVVSKDILLTKTRLVYSVLFPSVKCANRQLNANNVCKGSF